VGEEPLIWLLGAEVEAVAEAQGAEVQTGAIF
jgi:hypothetical protein